MCPFYYQVKPIMSESVAVNPLYIGESGVNGNVQELLFDTSYAQGLEDSVQEEFDNPFEGNTSVEDEPKLEENLSIQHGIVP